jgi:hypothetical protein
MKNFSLLTINTLIVIFLFSCSKEIPTEAPASKPATPTPLMLDTIKPLEYFPAYPGSYWKYSNNATMRVSDQYMMYVYNSASYSAPPHYDTLVLPQLSTEGIYPVGGDSYMYINEYSRSKGSPSSYRDPAFAGILETTEGKLFAIGGAFQGHAKAGQTIKTDTSIFIGTQQYEHVIVTVEFDYACRYVGGLPVEECAYKREYYAKDIGLIKREIKDSIFKTAFELVEYNINK